MRLRMAAALQSRVEGAPGWVENEDQREAVCRKSVRGDTAEVSRALVQMKALEGAHLGEKPAARERRAPAPAPTVDGDQPR